MANTNISGYSIDLDGMKSSTCGMIGIATKNGKKYFCKTFNNPVEPDNNGALSAKAIAKNRAAFDDFKRRKTRINKTLREVSGLGGNIVFPIDETIYEHHWTEFTEFIEDALPEDQYSTVIASLDEKEKLLVLKIAIGALQTIHGQKIVHGDLKLTNIMLVKNSMGHYVSKIIDFDGAFFEDDVPIDSITGTVDYYSPELAFYSSYEEPEIREKISKMITTKSDIFTMGLILHEYLTGKKPEPDHLTSSLQRLKDSGKFIYPWQILLTNDKDEEKPQLVISDRITEPAYVALISDMLNLEPDHRPSAVEVLNRLNNKQLPIEKDVWPEDRILINEAKAKELVLGLRKLELSSKDKETIHTYEIIEKDGRRYTKSKDDLIRLGLASTAESWQEPRKEDNITWNIDELKKMFTSVTPDRPGIYKLLDKHGNERKLSVPQLVMMKFAVKTGDITGSTTDGTTGGTTGGSDADLWPADAENFKLNKDMLHSQNMIFIGKTTMHGVNGYKFTRRGSEMFLDSQRCKMMKFLISK